MSNFTFDLEAAINQIATLEAAIATPTPGIINSYGFGLNPSRITDPSVLPAVVHLNRGPINTGLYTHGQFEATFEVVSLMLISEVIRNIYPSDESHAVTYWEPILETFLDLSNHAAINTAATCSDYNIAFDTQPAFDVRTWPPEPAPVFSWYWSFQYTHRFTFEANG